MNKLILLDGPYGVGKTAAALCICAKSDGKYVCIDPDEYFNNNVKRYGLRGGPIPNNTLIKEDIKKEVEKQIKNKNVIIPLALNTREYAEEWTKLFRDIADVKRVILYASKKILVNRIENAKGRNKELALNSLDANLKYYDGITEGAFGIDTSKLDVEEVANKILELVE